MKTENKKLKLNKESITSLNTLSSIKGGIMVSGPSKCGCTATDNMTLNDE